MNDQLTPVPGDDAGRILLVDDEATNLDVLRATLAGPNYRLFVARSGEDAFHASVFSWRSSKSDERRRTRTPRQPTIKFFVRVCESPRHFG